MKDAVLETDGISEYLTREIIMAAAAMGFKIVIKEMVSKRVDFNINNLFDNYTKKREISRLF